jgi:hypothetical protein
VADLYRNDPNPRGRATWLNFAIALMKRGVKPVDKITVHGPHEGANYEWAHENDGVLCITPAGGRVQVTYSTQGGRFRAWEWNGPRFKPTALKRVPLSSLPARWRKSLEVMQRELRDLG